MFETKSKPASLGKYMFQHMLLFVLYLWNDPSTFTPHVSALLPKQSFALSDSLLPTAAIPHRFCELTSWWLGLYLCLGLYRWTNSLSTTWPLQVRITESAQNKSMMCGRRVGLHNRGDSGAGAHHVKTILALLLQLLSAHITRQDSHPETLATFV